ncbi:hypothetical protein [Rhodococcus oryzae]|jgi:hypothetical protein|uniref:hypothetical protein n=1 Tax=Rhodococcus oryzae TaxID=2571143 RepID=UPI0037B2A35F
MTQPPQWQPGPPPPTTTKPAAGLWIALRIVGTAIGALFLLLAVSFLITDPLFLSGALMVAIAWPLLYFSLVVPILKRRNRATAAAATPPGNRAGTVLRNLAIGVAAPFALLVLAGALDVAVHYDELEVYGAETGTSVQATPASPPPPTESTAAPAPLTFSESMVRAHGVSKEHKGGQSNVRYVAGTDDAEQVKTLQKQCVQHYLEKTKAAYCYGYANDADYALTTIEWDAEFDESAYGGGRPCWIVYGGQPLNGPPGTETGKEAYEYTRIGCPGAVRFPGQPVPAPAAAPTGPPAPAVPAHNPCALLEPSTLTAGGFEERTAAAPGAPDEFARGDTRATYVCGNADSGVVIEIALLTSPEAARAQADDATSAEQTFLINTGTRVPFDATRGGAKIVNTKLGISRISWSNGPYAVQLDVMTDPVIAGLTPKHPLERIDTMVDATVQHADQLLTSGTW